MATPRTRSKLEGLRRLFRYRLVMPVLRAKHPPDYTARSVGIGLMVAMTPTVGAQMAIVVAIWFVARWIRPAWDFNVVIAALWTWVTNVFTVAPVYYLFLVTGRVMIGAIGGHGGYEEFSGRLSESLGSDTGYVESLWIYTVALFQNWGVPLFLGAAPWAVLTAVLGYWWTLRLVTKRRAARKRKRIGGTQ